MMALRFFGLAPSKGHQSADELLFAKLLKELDRFVTFMTDQDAHEWDPPFGCP
jgi:hypothetical protein